MSYIEGYVVITYVKYMDVQYNRHTTKDSLQMYFLTDILLCKSHTVFYKTSTHIFIHLIEKDMHLIQKDEKVKVSWWKMEK